jgi:hypothetical protein
VPNETFGPVSGLISGLNLNRRLPMREHSGISTILLLIYRCGGSVGFDDNLTNFPFNQRLERRLEPESRPLL